MKKRLKHGIILRPISTFIKDMATDGHIGLQ
nr:MAG TPA: hypothetical protein [Caudoviricetes sp.]